MVGKRLLKLEEMEPIAKAATRAALEGYSLSKDKVALLTLGTEITEAEGIFELYIPGSRPQDAKVLTRATVDRSSGSVGIEVFAANLG